MSRPADMGRTGPSLFFGHFSNTLGAAIIFFSSLTLILRCIVCLILFHAYGWRFLCWEIRLHHSSILAALVWSLCVCVCDSRRPRGRWGSLVGICLDSQYFVLIVRQTDRQNWPLNPRSCPVPHSSHAFIYLYGSIITEHGNLLLIAGLTTNYIQFSFWAFFEESSTFSGEPSFFCRLLLAGFLLFWDL